LDKTSNSPRTRTAVRAYSRAAGVLFIVTIVAGGFGEAYAPGQLIASGNAAATVASLKAHDALFRLSFAAYLAEALSDIALAAIFYVLLKPVSRGMALTAALFGVFSTAFYATCELFYFALPHLLLSDAPYLNAFTPEQIAALVMLSIKLFGYGAGLSFILYGTGWIIRSWLMIRSGYFPLLLGALMMVGGLGFVAHTLADVLAPQYSSDLMLMLLMPGSVLLAMWLLIWGVDPEKWSARLVSSPD
jgi:hypothetical protein